MGRSFAELIHDEDRSKVTEGVMRILAGGSEPLEFQAITAAGEIRWLRASNSPVVETVMWWGSAVWR